MRIKDSLKERSPRRHLGLPPFTFSRRTRTWSMGVCWNAYWPGIGGNWLVGLMAGGVASIGSPTPAPAVSPTLVSFAFSSTAYFANFYSVKCPIFPSNLLITSSTVYWFGLDDFAIASAIIGTCVKNIWSRSVMNYRILPIRILSSFMALLLSIFFLKSIG